MTAIGPNGNGTSPLIRVPLAAEELTHGCASARVLYGWIASGVIPEAVVVRAGRAIYLRRALFEAWLAGAEKPTR